MSGVQRFAALLFVPVLLLAACAPAATPPKPAPSTAGGPTAPSSGAAQQEGYAHPELLAETDWLAQRLNGQSLRVVDLRSPNAYRAGHLPGAVQLDGARLKDPQDKLHVTSPEVFKPMMEELGIGDDTLVVAYDDQAGLWAARLWWVLDYYSHPQARVLNGGWQKWAKEQLPTSPETPRPDRASFTPKVNEGTICGIDQVKAAAESPDFAIVDARTTAEYSGTDVRAARGGHVPKAINVDWQRNVTTADPKVWKPAAELRAMYEAAGVARDKQVITYCQTAVRAAHSFFTLRLIGYGQVRNYDGSWAEWGSDASLPIAR
ncbi:MAG: sulfurtransferase [Chloroflexi bacterium]|nr:sulfurtransferase [Chloroflexota bacterium]